MIALVKLSNILKEMNNFKEWFDTNMEMVIFLLNFFLGAIGFSSYICWLQLKSTWLVDCSKTVVFKFYTKTKNNLLLLLLHFCSPIFSIVGESTCGFTSFHGLNMGSTQGLQYPTRLRTTRSIETWPFLTGKMLGFEFEQKNDFDSWLCCCFDGMVDQ